MNPSRIIPRDIDKFYSYICNTDNKQAEVDTVGFTIYPVEIEGNTNFTNKESGRKLIDQRMSMRWEWTDEDARQWTNFRQNYHKLYKQFEKAAESKKLTIEIQL